MFVGFLTNQEHRHIFNPLMILFMVLFIVVIWPSRIWWFSHSLFFILEFSLCNWDWARKKEGDTKFWFVYQVTATTGLGKGGDSLDRVSWRWKGLWDSHWQGCLPGLFTSKKNWDSYTYPLPKFPCVHYIGPTSITLTCRRGACSVFSFKGKIYVFLNATFLTECTMLVWFIKWQISVQQF